MVSIRKDDPETQVDSAVDDQVERKMEDLCVVPVSKERDIRRFGLSVRVDTEFQLPSQKACSFPLPRCDELALGGIPTSQERDSGEPAEPSSQGKEIGSSRPLVHLHARVSTYGFRHDLSRSRYIQAFPPPLVLRLVLHPFR
jgi:hypothetical protein